MNADSHLIAARATVQELRDFVAWDTTEIAQAADVMDDALDHLESELEASVSFRHEREDQLIQELNGCSERIQQYRYFVERLLAPPAFAAVAAWMGSREPDSELTALLLKYENTRAAARAFLDGASGLVR